MLRKLLVGATALFAGAMTAPAQAALMATPITGQLIAGGAMRAVLVHVEARDRSTLSRDQAGGGGPALLLRNIGPSADVIGATRGPFGGAGGARAVRHGPPRPWRPGAPPPRLSPTRWP